MTTPCRRIKSKCDKHPYGGYIDPETPDKTDPSKPAPLVELVKSCDRLKQELEQTKFANALRDLVCEASAPTSSTTAVGQKRQADSTTPRHPNSPLKLRRTQLRSHLLSAAQHLPVPLLPPPQTEPVNLSSKSNSGSHSTTTETSITPPSPIGSPISTTNMFAQLLILSGMLPQLLKMSSQVCSPSSPGTLSTPVGLRTPFGPLSAPSQHSQAAFFP